MGIESVKKPDLSPSLFVKLDSRHIQDRMRCKDDIWKCANQGALAGFEVDNCLFKGVYILKTYFQEHQNQSLYSAACVCGGRIHKGKVE